MDDPWNILRAAGLPDGAVRPPRALPPRAQMREALSMLASGLADVTLRDRELLFAWLRAYSHHWPTAFNATFGSTGASMLRALENDRFDPNRYLKLRRIAIENLARAEVIA